MVAATDLLFAALVLALTLLVDAAEVGHNDRHWQGDDKHSAQRTDPTDHLACDRLRYHVAVSASHAYIY